MFFFFFFFPLNETKIDKVIYPGEESDSMKPAAHLLDTLCEHANSIMML